MYSRGDRMREVEGVGGASEHVLCAAKEGGALRLVRGMESKRTKVGGGREERRGRET